MLAAAGEASPHARGLILVELHTWLDWLEGWLRRRLRPADATDVYVATLASGLVGASEAAFRVWLRQAAPPRRLRDVARHGIRRRQPHDPASRDCFTAAIGHVRTGLDPQRATARRAPPDSLPTSRRPPCPPSCTASAAGAPPTPGAR